MVLALTWTCFAKTYHKKFIPVGFAALIPNLQQEEPFFPTAQTCPHGPHDIPIKG